MKKILNREDIPRHVAIMLDGNRRWAKKNLYHQYKNYLNQGYWAGAEALLPIVRYAKEVGIEVLTVWGLSTENLHRPKTELNILFNIYETFLRNHRDEMVRMGVKFETIGDLSPLPKAVNDEIELTKQATKECRAITLVVALNYGGRDDLKRAIQKMVEKAVKKEEITEDFIKSHLDTAPYADPDLLIRTSGEMRVSNFLLWQLAYTEIYVTDVLWPDFKPRDLDLAVSQYQNRERRHGR